MPNTLIETLAGTAIILVLGLVIALFDRKGFSAKWLLVSVGLMLVYGLVHTYGNGWASVPWETRWNWVPKIVNTLLLIGVASLPAFGWKRVGLTLRQDRAGLRAVMPFVGLYGFLFIGLAIAEPPSEPTLDTVMFQLTMPSIEEELFYRGVLLFALYKAFAGRLQMFGVTWGWGAVLSSVAFGLGHALDYSAGGFSFEAVYFLATAIPSMAGVWVRLRTGSLLIPVLMHTFGNTASYFL